MIEVVNFKPIHLTHISPNGAPGAAAWISPAEAAVLMGHPSKTVRLRGQPIMCAGAYRIWGQRYQAWACLDQRARTHGLRLINEIRRFLGTLGPCRIEAAVASGFPEGFRFARICGFSPVEMDAEFFMPGGGSATTFVRVQK
jgi:hypothetical protein